VALVGYTNAGKSSWMRALTGSGVHVEDKLFATLDTTVRALQPETSPRILCSDTVGFISNLPHDLVASFRSTLDEARDSDLLVHVVDAADPAFRAQIEVTREVLDSIGAGRSPRLVVLNKVDRLDAAARARLAAEWPEALLLSAKDPADAAKLRERLVAFFERDMEEAELHVPYAQQRWVAEAHAGGRVVSESHDATGTRLLLRAPPAVWARLRAALEPAAVAQPAAAASRKGRAEPGAGEKPPGPAKQPRSAKPPTTGQTRPGAKRKAGAQKQPASAAKKKASGAKKKPSGRTAPARRGAAKRRR
jgi:GTP-binding protein HflX